MLGSRGIGSDEGQVDLGAGHSGQFYLCLLGGLTETLQGHAVLGQVDSRISLEFVDEPVDDAAVKVVTSQVCVTGGGLHLKHTVS